MALERLGAQHHMAVVDKWHNPTTTYAMTTRDYVLRPDATDGAFTITLPAVAKAKGRFYSIFAQYADNTNAITITANGSEIWAADIVLNEKGRGGIFYSDGMKWTYTPWTDLTFTSSLVAGAVRLREFSLTMAVTSNVNQIEAVRSEVIVNDEVKTGAWCNAFMGKLTYGTGIAHGECSVFCAELALPNVAVTRGHYFAYSAEFNCQTNYDHGNNPVSFAKISVWGAAATQFDAIATVFDITGVTSTAGGFFYTNAVAFNNADAFLKVSVNDVIYYIPLSDNQGGT